MFYEEIRIKQNLSYILSCPLRILYNSKFILLATSLGKNAVVVTRVHCIFISLPKHIILHVHLVNTFIHNVYFLAIDKLRFNQPNSHVTCMCNTRQKNRIICN